LVPKQVGGIHWFGGPSLGITTEVPKTTSRERVRAESFFATIKRELIDTQAWPTRAGLRRAVFEYIEGWYNTRRLHSSLGYMSSAKYEALIHHNADRQAA
jgi:transposase InsO family protein